MTRPNLREPHAPEPIASRRRPRGLVSEIVGALEGEIRTGTLPVGQKLPTEAEIMARFDVSRTVVREALSRLQASALVETRHGIGTFVSAQERGGNFRISDQDFATVADVIAVLELRISLETEAAGLAALHVCCLAAEKVRRESKRISNRRWAQMNADSRGE